jgi:diguanylate cyclase (GGDEF)-like protein
MLLRESSRANRENKTLGLMMLDIDHFKQVNDVYGHLSGDLILQVIGKNLQQWIRMEDTVYRYGGEEFLTVLPGMSLQNITERANSICSRVAELQFVVTPEATITVTVSIGVALYPIHGDDINQVLKCADQALYGAKRAGRNTVFVWNATTPASSFQ